MESGIYIMRNKMEDLLKDGTATIIASAKDLTSDKARPEALVENCNRLGLSSIHFDDVAEDFLIG